MHRGGRHDMINTGRFVPCVGRQNGLRHLIQHLMPLYGWVEPSVPPILVLLQHNYIEKKMNLRSQGCLKQKQNSKD